MQIDITEDLIRHCSLADVLAFAAARAEVRGIDVGTTGTSPTVLSPAVPVHPETLILASAMLRRRAV